MLWIGEGDEAKTPGSLSLPVLDNNHLKNRSEAAEVVFQSLLISVEVEPSHEELPFFRGHGGKFKSWNLSKRPKRQLPPRSRETGQERHFLKKSQQSTNFNLIQILLVVFPVCVHYSTVGGACPCVCVRDTAPMKTVCMLVCVHFSMYVPLCLCMWPCMCTMLHLR